jgi:hypothetical protein
MEELGRKELPKPKKPKCKKRTEIFTCKLCIGQYAYTDARGSGGDGKKSCEKERPTKETSVRARAPEEPVQGLRQGHLRARAPEGPVQGLWYGLLRARAPEGSVQGLRHRPLRAWAPEGLVQGLHRPVVRAPVRQRGTSRRPEQKAASFYGARPAAPHHRRCKIGSEHLQEAGPNWQC